VSETIISGIIVAGLAVMGAMLAFVLAVTTWTEFQEWRDKRRDKK